MDPVQTAIILSYSEIKGVCELLVKSTNNEGVVGQHILDIMSRNMTEARAEVAKIESLVKSLKED
jgi:hypothetical protein